MFKNMKLRTKLIQAFLVIGLIPLSIIVFIFLIKANDAISKASFNKMAAVLEIKKNQIEDFFKERKNELEVLSDIVGTLREEAFKKLKSVQMNKKIRIENFFADQVGDVSILASSDTVIAALFAFEVAFMMGDSKTEGEAWLAAEEQYRQWFDEYRKNYDFNDFILIGMEGDILYSISKGSDLGENIKYGPLKESPLGKCYKKAFNGIAIQDFEPYAPFNNEPCAFVGAPIKNDNTVIGIVALRLSIDAINNIMQKQISMGKTVDIYLVGPDKLMRSNSYLDPNNHSVIKSFMNPEKGMVDTEASSVALSGKEGTKIIINHMGNMVLSAFNPLSIEGLNWAIISEIDVAEAFCPENDSGKEFFAQYKERYGYYDLFLMNPDGYCFYTVEKESDYQTNFINGKYSKSNLGTLVRKVLDKRKFGIADFTPYAPRDNEPCAFVAQPVMHNEEVLLIAALQLSLKPINRIMHQHEGMGKSGETYLIGQDKLMRSDSYLDPKHHSVQASFADPTKGCIDTEASRAALARHIGQDIIKSYRGNKVLSAYTPVNIGDITWALISEIDESEAFEMVNTLKLLGVIIIIISFGAIIALALTITHKITKPLVKITSIAQEIARGDILTATEFVQSIGISASTIKQDDMNISNDETEQLLQATAIMTQNLNSLVGQVQKSTIQLMSSSNEIAATSREQEATMKEFGASTKVVVSSAKNISQTSNDLVSTMNEVTNMAEETASSAGNGHQGLMEMASTMEQMEKASQSISLKLAAINEKAENVTNVVTTITKVADQTNLLSLNAAIEAEKAGEYGLGFSVVAIEIRRLADQTAVATLDIAQMVKEMQAAVSAGVMEMDKFTKEVHLGVQEVNLISAQLIQIIEKVQTLKPSFEEVNKGMDSQSQRAHQISESMIQLSEGADQNISSLIEFNKTTQRLNEAASGLRKEMSKFKVSS